MVTILVSEGDLQRYFYEDYDIDGQHFYEYLNTLGYHYENQITLDAVASLRGVMAVEEAPKGIFVTTSAYLPSARHFAGRTSGALELAASDDVLRWCKAAEHGIIKDKSTLVSPTNVTRLLAQLGPKPDPRVLHSSGGYSRYRGPA